MRLTTDIERGAWLHERIGKAWATVGAIAGTGFARYARVLHPIEADRVDLATTDERGGHPIIDESTWPWREVAKRNGKSMHALVQWRRITDDEAALDFPDGWRAYQSREGWFDPILMARLTEHLRGHTGSPDDVTAGIWNGWGIPTTFWTGYLSLDGDEAAAASAAAAAAENAKAEAEAAYSPEYRHALEHGPFLTLPGREYVLFTTSLAELADPNWGDDAGIGWSRGFGRDPSPQLVWPKDHAWVVGSEIDWDSTIVAGPAPLIDAVLTDPSFESYEVSELDDLSWAGDTINP